MTSLPVTGLDEAHGAIRTALGLGGNAPHDFRHYADVISRVLDESAKWRDEASSLLARAMRAELAAARRGVASPCPESPTPQSTAPRPLRLTERLLRERGFSAETISGFASLFPLGLELTEKNCERLDRTFDVSSLASNVLTPAQHAFFCRRMEAALDARDAALRPFAEGATVYPERPTNERRGAMWLALQKAEGVANAAFREARVSAFHEATLLQETA